ncbi:RNA polymerase sigma factor SigW [Paenibacillus thalictri]|uniref:RNA polymerase sigma factor n=1 Tax=Paenibacillus thalictri TaxID=2527873 RepID=A0A4Q9DYZ9_9BACL|nr:RNA polymerase sigma factor SigW [Paenibacillus thalictri]TBL81138.1 RNA polymerase sigma factor SigW [Paenibacillus thalictri]
MNYAETNLIKLSRSGDRNAFAELVELYQEKIQKLAYKMLNNRLDTEDIVQETFIRVYLNLNRFDESQNFSTWIYRIGKNLCIDLLRKKKKNVYSLDAEFSEDEDANYYARLHSDETTPEHRLIEKETKSQMMKVISKLSEKYRTVVLLYYIQGLSLLEISEKLNLPVTTVKSRLNRGREHLRKKMGHGFIIGLMVFFCNFITIA